MGDLGGATGNLSRTCKRTFRGNLSGQLEKPFVGTEGGGGTFRKNGANLSGKPSNYCKPEEPFGGNQNFTGKPREPGELGETEGTEGRFGGNLGNVSGKQREPGESFGRIGGTFWELGTRGPFREGTRDLSGEPREPFGEPGELGEPCRGTFRGNLAGEPFGEIYRGTFQGNRENEGNFSGEPGDAFGGTRGTVGTFRENQ